MTSRISPEIRDLSEHIGRQNRVQKKFIDHAISMLTDDEIGQFSGYIKFFLSNGASIETLAEHYNQIVKDMVREQLFFKKNRKYRYSTYEEVASSVYMNDSYMNGYMQGLALTTYLWPNHIEMARWFAKVLPKNIRGSYFEVGPGHGLHFLKAMESTSYDEFTAIDISPTSVALTQKILKSGFFGDFSRQRYQIVQGDFFDQPDGKIVEAFVMGEVLEHVERPDRFIKKIYNITNANSFIYLSTVINSPAVDHIYLFRRFEDIQELLVAGGLRVKDHLLLPYSGTSLQRSFEESLPVNVSVVVEKII